ncbi:unnamed protein product, partial [Cylicostephanus goldi]
SNQETDVISPDITTPSSDIENTPEATESSEQGTDAASTDIAPPPDVEDPPATTEQTDQATDVASADMTTPPSDQENPSATTELVTEMHKCVAFVLYL